MIDSFRHWNSHFWLSHQEPEDQLSALFRYRIDSDVFLSVLSPESISIIIDDISVVLIGWDSIDKWEFLKHHTEKYESSIKHINKVTSVTIVSPHLKIVLDAVA
jgi:hypothetical protein